MKFSNNIFLCQVLCLLSINAFPQASTSTKAKVSNDLINLVLQTTNYSSPATIKCFNTYLPQLSEISTTFSTQYQACSDMASQQTSSLNTQATENRTQMYQQASAICTAFQSCQSASDNMAAFSCFSTASTEGLPTLYYLAQNASFAAADVGNTLRSIQNQQDQCKNYTEQIYITNTAAAYALLDNCLQTAALNNQTTNVTADLVVELLHTSNAVNSSNQNGMNPSCQHLNPVESNKTTQLYCQCGNATQIHIETSADGTQILNQTGCLCELTKNSTQNLNSTSNGVQIYCLCANGINLRMETTENGISVQTQSQNGVGCGCTIDGSSGTQSQSQCNGSECGNQTLTPIFTLPTMSPMSPMPSMAPMTPMPPIPPMSPIPPMPPMSPIPPMVPFE